MKESQVDKGKWNWFCVGSQFQAQSEGKPIHISLLPKSAFYRQGQNGQSQNLKVILHINLEKAFKYEDDLGWTWHKSTKIPFISIRVDLFSQSDESVYKPPQELHARLYAAKLKYNSYENEDMCLEDVGLNGIVDIPLEKNFGHFTGIKFRSTSYNHEGAKFYLLIVIYLKKTSSETETIISSSLSSPIFVDSRKCARDFHEHKFLSYVQLFPPSLLSQNFQKKTGKGEKKMEVNDSLEGLNNYLTAANIRNKIKHPLYFAIKFSKVFNIYFHNSLFEGKFSIVDVMKKFQKKLVKELSQGYRKIDIDNGEKKFIITVSVPFSMKDKKKVLSYFEDLKTKSILVCLEEANFENEFTNFKKIGNLANGYKQLFRLKKETPQLEMLNQKAQQFLQSPEQQIVLPTENIFQKQATYEEIGKKAKQQIKVNIYEGSDDEEGSNYKKSREVFLRRERQNQSKGSKYRGEKLIYPEKEEEKNKLNEINDNEGEGFISKIGSAFQFISKSNPNFSKSLEEPKPFVQSPNHETAFRKNSKCPGSSNSSLDNQNQANQRLALLRNEVLKNEIFNQIDLNNALMRNLINQNETLKMKVNLLFQSMKSLTEPSQEMKWSSESSLKDRQSN